MYKPLGVGLLISLFTVGCTVPPQGVIHEDKTPQIQDEIVWFYDWLLKTHQLSRPVTPYHKTWPKPQRVNPETQKPTTEELNQRMKDPTFREKFYKGRRGRV